MTRKIRTQSSTAFSALLGAGLWAALAAATALAQQMPYGYGGNYGDHMSWGWGAAWLMGPVMMLLFFGAPIVLVILLVRWLWPSHRHEPAPQPTARSRALHILEERFARGEIDKAEFEEKRQTLRE